MKAIEPTGEIVQSVPSIVLEKNDKLTIIKTKSYVALVESVACQTTKLDDVCWWSLVIVYSINSFVTAQKTPFANYVVS